MIKSVKDPLSLMTKVIGEGVTTVEEVVDQLIHLKSTLGDLFNGRAIEALFVRPFDSVITSAVSSFDKLVAIVERTNKPDLPSAMNVIKPALRDAYGALHDALNAVSNSIKEVIGELRDVEGQAIQSVHQELASIIALSQSMKSDVAEFKTRIEGFVKVKTGNTFEVDPEFPTTATHTGINTNPLLTKTGDQNVSGFSDEEGNVSTRFKAEHGAMDLVMIAIILAVLSIPVGIFMITRNIMLVGILAMFAALAIPIFLLVYGW
jgi:hypothetical protein